MPLYLYISNTYINISFKNLHLTNVCFTLDVQDGASR